LPTDSIRRQFSITATGTDEKLLVATHKLVGSPCDQSEALRQLVLKGVGLQEREYLARGVVQKSDNSREYESATARP